MQNNWRDAAWDLVRATFDRIIMHPFVQGLANGDLPPSCFSYYVKQDVIYLEKYARNINLLVEKISTSSNNEILNSLDLFRKFSEQTMAAEKALHSILSQQFNIDFSDLNINFLQNEASTSYTDSIYKKIDNSSIEEGLVAILPCFWMYNKVGHYIYNLGLEKLNENPYKLWIETYKDEEFTNDVGKFLDLVDHIMDNKAKTLGKENFAVFEKKINQIFLEGCDYEYRFWDAAYGLGKEGTFESELSLSNIGEFGLIEKIRKGVESTLDGYYGIGDDCAVISKDDKTDLVVSTDMLVEQIHFDLDKISPRELARKSLVVNISDIAAMGGIPKTSFMSIAIPSHINMEFIDDFISEYLRYSKEQNVILLGGDTTKSKADLIINICVTGEIEKGRSRLRSYAKAGDLICVTGFLGDSGAGLKILMDEKSDLSPGQEYLVLKHHNPKPKIKEGVILGRYVNAMMDISDGIASDLKHILTESNVSAKVNLDKLPVSRELSEICLAKGWDSLELAVGAGEDYELLFTVSPNEIEIIRKELLEKDLGDIFVIGEVIEKEENLIIWQVDNKKCNFDAKGFNHFKNE